VKGLIIQCRGKKRELSGVMRIKNVLIDTNSDLWIIDFGGGCTRGFVEKEKAGTAEGDLEGSGKILEFVFREIED
jgi:hypothetical protein